MTRLLVSALVGAAALLASAGRAHAADDRAPRASEIAAQDDVRVRGGTVFQLGPALVLDRGEAFAFGFEGHLGVQLNDVVGIYVAPSAQLAFAMRGLPSGGAGFSAAAVVDLTFGDRFTVGLGPEVGRYARFTDEVAPADGSAPRKYGANMFGGRLHLAWNATVDSSSAGGRRKAAVFGVDVRAATGDALWYRDEPNFILMPTLFGGHEWL